MHGNLEPEENVWSDNKLNIKIYTTLTDINQSINQNLKIRKRVVGLVFTLKKIFNSMLWMILTFVTQI